MPYATAEEFAAAILRRHPQISFEHALAAAEFEAAPRPSRAVLAAAARALGLEREDLDQPDADAGASGLQGQLDQLLGEFEETRSMHRALIGIRAVVRAAIEADEQDGEGG